MKLPKLSTIAASLLLTIPLALTACAPSRSFTTGPIVPGPIAGNRVFVDNTRGYPFAEFQVIQGVPPNVTMQIYNTSGVTPFTDAESAKFNAIDRVALAKEIGATAVVMNPRRYWLMNRFWSYGAGETHDFSGIAATWMAGLEMKNLPIAEHGKPFAAYVHNKVTRQSKYEWDRGSEVYLLRSPDGHTWIMQAFTDLVDKSLTIRDLPKLGSKLKLPEGWKFEVKVLERNLTLSPPAPDFTAHAVSDDFQNIYAGCDFGTTCNYIP